jgi:hypothetical protein
MTAARTKKNEVTNIDNINDEEGENEMNNEARTQTVITNGNSHINGNGNHRLSEIRPIDLSLEEFDALTPEQLTNLVIPRLSRIRTKAELVSRIKSGKIKIGQPSTLINWTFKNVQVTGVSINSRGTKDAKVTLSQEEFNALTNDQKADLIEKHTRERRASEEIFPALLKLGLKLTAYDTVYLTCGRVAIEGIVVEGNTKKQVAIVDGVEFE